jgi:hypothetical protein
VRSVNRGFVPRGFRLILVGGLLLVLTSCFPSRPDFSGPVALTVSGGELAFVQCAAPEIDAGAINFTVGEATSNDGEVWMLIAADAGASDDVVRIPFRSPVTASSSLGDLPRRGEDVLSPDDLKGAAAGYLKIVAENIRIEQNFEFDASDLEEGRYIYPSGEVSDEPCGMEGAYKS